MYKPARVVFPSSLKEASRVLKELEGRALIVAGNTTVHEMAHRGLLDHIEVIVDLSKLGLSYIKHSGDYVLVGAYTRLADILNSWVLSSNPRSLNSLREAVLEVPKQVRNVATIGGSVASSLPYYDVPVSLLALNSRVRVHGLSGTRELGLEEFMVAPRMPDLGPDEFVYEIAIPAGDYSASVFEKFSINEFDYALMSLAVSVRVEGGVVSKANLVVGGGVPKVSSIPEASKLIEGTRLSDEDIERAAKKVYEVITPLEDFKASSEYRRHLSRVLAVRAMRRVRRILRGA